MSARGLRVVVDGGYGRYDHISLPGEHLKKRENGLRADLVQAPMTSPGVFRFPGGCIIEGNSLATVINGRIPWVR